MTAGLCWIALNIVAGPTDVDPREPFLFLPGPNLQLIPIRPKSDAFNAGAKTAIVLNRGGSVYVRETTTQIAFAKCQEAPK